MSTSTTGNGQAFSVEQCKERDGGWCGYGVHKAELRDGPDRHGTCHLRYSDGLLATCHVDDLSNLPSSAPSREPVGRVALFPDRMNLGRLEEGKTTWIRAAAVGSNYDAPTTGSTETRYVLPLTPDGEGGDDDFDVIGQCEGCGKPIRTRDKYGMDADGVTLHWDCATPDMKGEQHQPPDGEGEGDEREAKKGGREWRPFPDECEVCGGEAQALVRRDTPDGQFMEEDEARCTDCRMPGRVVVDEEDERAQVRWHDCGDGEEACMWCQMRDAYENAGRPRSEQERRIRTALGCSSDEQTVEAVERVVADLNSMAGRRNYWKLRAEEAERTHPEPLRVNGEPVRVQIDQRTRATLGRGGPGGTVGIGVYLPHDPQVVSEHEYHLIPADAAGGGGQGEKHTAVDADGYVVSSATPLADALEYLGSAMFHLKQCPDDEGQHAIRPVEAAMSYIDLAKQQWPTPQQGERFGECAKIAEESRQNYYALQRALNAGETLLEQRDAARQEAERLREGLRDVAEPGCQAPGVLTCIERDLDRKCFPCLAQQALNTPPTSPGPGEMSEDWWIDDWVGTDGTAPVPVLMEGSELVCNRIHGATIGIQRQRAEMIVKAVNAHKKQERS